MTTRRGTPTPPHETMTSGPPSGRRPIARKAATESSAPESPEALALMARFERAFASISLRVEQGAYAAEHCSMLLEIAHISTARECPEPLRARAVELLLRLGRRTTEETPCRRGVREMIAQCAARGLKL